MSSERDLAYLTVPEVSSLEDAIGAIESHKFDSGKVADEINREIDMYILELESKLPKIIGNISCLSNDIINISQNEDKKDTKLSVSGRDYRVKINRCGRWEKTSERKLLFRKDKEKRVEFSELEILEDYQYPLSISFEFEDNSRSMNLIALRISSEGDRSWMTEKTSEIFIKRYLSFVNERLRVNSFNQIYADLPYLLNQVPSLIGSIYGENLNLRKQKLKSVETLSQEIKSLEVSNF